MPIQRRTERLRSSAPSSDAFVPIGICNLNTPCTRRQTKRPPTAPAADPASSLSRYLFLQRSARQLLDDDVELFAAVDAGGEVDAQQADVVDVAAGRNRDVADATGGNLNRVRVERFDAVGGVHAGREFEDLRGARRRQVQVGGGPRGDRPHSIISSSGRLPGASGTGVGRISIVCGTRREDGVPGFGAGTSVRFRCASLSESDGSLPGGDRVGGEGDLGDQALVGLRTSCGSGAAAPSR